MRIYLGLQKHLISQIPFTPASFIKSFIPGKKVIPNFFRWERDVAEHYGVILIVDSGDHDKYSGRSTYLIILRN